MDFAFFALGGGGQGPSKPTSLGDLPESVRDAARAALKHNHKLADMSLADRELAAEAFDAIAQNASGVASRTARLYNLERAKFLRGQVDHIAGTLQEFAKEYGYPEKNVDWK